MRFWSMMGKRFECFANCGFLLVRRLGRGRGRQIVRMGESEAEIK